MSETNYDPWWRPINHSVVITIEHAAIDYSSLMYFVEVHDQLGEKHRFRCTGLFWQGRDVRIERGIPPAVGEWERVPAPGEPLEFDLDELDTIEALKNNNTEGTE